MFQNVVDIFRFTIFTDLLELMFVMISYNKQITRRVETKNIDKQNPLPGGGQI
jgi:hypothetical protein